MSEPSNNKNVMKAHYKSLRPAAPFHGDEVVVVRHSETISEVFPDWIDRCKLDFAFYQPFDLNMPVRLPRRENMMTAYQHDPPISEVGRITAQIFARELVTRNGVPKAIFSSPSLASVQTAADIRNFIGSECGNIHIEPALASDRTSSSFWMSPKEFAQLKYNVDEGYSPEQPDRNDKSSNSKSENLKKMIQKLARSKGTPVLIITDAAALNTLSSGDNKGSGDDEHMRKEAANAFPPLSSVILSLPKGKENLEPSRLFVRPLTMIGECSRPEIEVAGDAK